MWVTGATAAAGPARSTAECGLICGSTSKRAVLGAASTETRAASMRPPFAPTSATLATSTAPPDNHTDAYEADLANTEVYEWVSFLLYVYITPILVITGVIGNLLSITVFFKSKLRGQSTSQYLSALALSDTVFLLQLVPPWLNAVMASAAFTRAIFCKVFAYLSYASCSASSWLVVAFTTERFVAVVYPLRSRRCTVRRARVAIAAIALCCLAVNTPMVWLAGPRDADCSIDSALLELASRFNVLDTVLSFTLPLAITAVLNVCIAVGVCRGGRALSPPPAPRAHARLRPRALPLRTRSTVQRSQQRVTRMLLLVSSVFVMLNLPAYSLRIAAYAWNMSSSEAEGRWSVLLQATQLLFHANFGINFFLYCLSGQNFRRALWHTFPWLERAARRLCCRAQVEPPPRASATNSLSINTEGKSSVAACAVSNLGGPGAAGWSRHRGPLNLRDNLATPGAADWSRQRGPLNLSNNLGAPGAAGWSRQRGPKWCPRHGDRQYPQRWRFDNTRQRHLDTSLELQVFHEVCIHHPRDPHRPLSIVPDPPPPVRMNHNTINQQIFRPISYEMIPGQIAPLNIDSMPPSPSLDPSPTPRPLAVAAQNGTARALPEPGAPAPGPRAVTEVPPPLPPRPRHFAPVVIVEEWRRSQEIRAPRWPVESAALPHEVGPEPVEPATSAFVRSEWMPHSLVTEDGCDFRILNIEIGSEE